MIILVILIFLFLCHVVFEIPWYALILGVIGFFALAIASLIIETKIQERIADSIESAKLIEEVAVYKKKTEHKGFSVTWHERHDHYAYTDVLDHYKCTFSVKYKDGSYKSITCRKDSRLYSRLIAKNGK